MSLDAQPARILIVTNGALGRNPRVFKEAAALGNAGFAVTVLGLRNHANFAEIDAGLVAGAPFRWETVDMLPGIGPRRLFPFWRRLQQWSARRALSAWRIETASALGPAGALLRRAHRLPAELTIVHNEAAHWVGTRLMAAGRSVAADIEDWHSEDLLPEAQRTRPLELIRRLEHTLLHRCVYTTTTSHALAAALNLRYGGAVPTVITNSFPLQTAPLERIPGEPPVFFWFSQTIGPGRGLEQFAAAWSFTRQPSRLVLLGATTDAYRDHIISLVPQNRRPDLEFAPLVTPDTLPTRIAQHDIGLALEPQSPQNKDLTISNKILQYLNAGLAVVASDTAGQREVLAHEPNAGLLVSLADPSRLAGQLDELLANRTALAMRQQAARRLAVETYCWEREAPRLVALVQSALAAGTNSFRPSASSR